MKTEKIKKKYLHYGLDKEDVYKHAHYLIITRSGIDKIQAMENITIDYEVINCERDFCVVKANASMSKHLLDNSQDRMVKIQTFGSALKGKSYADGNCTNFYVMEMAEKRAMSRAVLKLTGFYELGVFGEDESEDFKKK